ncbi:hypothetical protein [Sphaerotilus sp.]|uniref:hypothetical protein n=1 Tax=Sphaerotilus sp. TaxID=2093942 RepID=UPI00286DB64D|nr:hypothetical protein [Sphaerotilus sp.]
MTRVSSPAQNPFSTASAADGAEPYVSPPSFRGVNYSVPGGYRHNFERSWLVPSWPVALGLLLVAGLLFYLRSDRLLSQLLGSTTTRVLAVERAASAVNPWTGEAHWGMAPKAAEAFPLNFPANLPPTAAGPATGAGVFKCVQVDGLVVYQQQRDCGNAASPIRLVSDSR